MNLKQTLASTLAFLVVGASAISCGNSSSTSEDNAKNLSLYNRRNEMYKSVKRNVQKFIFSPLSNRAQTLLKRLSIHAKLNLSTLLLRGFSVSMWIKH